MSVLSLGYAGPAAINSFFAALLTKIVPLMAGHQVDNTDFLRFPGHRLKVRVKDRILHALSKTGLTYSSKWERDAAKQHMHTVLENATELQEAYTSLANDESRALLVDIVALRMLGPRRVRLRTNNSKYWDATRRVLALENGGNSIPTTENGGFALKLFNLESVGYEIRLVANPISILNTYLFEQYRHRLPSCEIAARPDDVVIDGGGCWGDTALYFASKTGSSGRVFTFEFAASNLEILARNLALNQDLAASIKVVPRALWSTSGECLPYGEGGPGTRVGLNGSKTATTISIDDFVRQEQLERLDFIKLDIEGAETRALEGGAESIRKFRPTLAVAAYHDFADIWRLPHIIKQLNPAYDIYLDHFTIHSEETIIFAISRA